MIPKAADLAAEQIVADMCSAPDGILRARARLSGWLGAVGALLHDLRQETGAADSGDDAYQTRLDAWQWAFTSAAACHPQTRDPLGANPGGSLPGRAWSGRDYAAATLL